MFAMAKIANTNPRTKNIGFPAIERPDAVGGVY